MHKPKLVIFDMDGLMFDTEKMGSRCHIQAAKEFGYTISEELSMSLIGGNMIRNTKLLKEALGEDCPLDKIRERSGEYREIHFQEHGLGVKPGLVELLDYLKSENIKMAIASSSGRVVIDRYLKMSGLEGRFDYIISGDMIHNSKPHPEIFLHVCEHFGLDVKEALVLEDSKNGILAAHAGNIPVICVPDLIFHEREIFEMTIATVSSLFKVKELLQGIKPKVAIFDMDGLMFNTEWLCIEPLIKAHHDYGYPMTKEICYKLIGTSGKIAKEILVSEFGTDYPYETVDRHAFALLREEIETNGLPMKKGLITLLERLKALNVTCVIASSSSSKTIEHYLEISNTRQYFKGIVGGDMVKASKPEPDVFIKACELFAVEPGQAIVLEDSKNGIIASNRAGIPVVCVPDLLMHDQGLLEQSEMFVSDLGKLADILG